MVARDWARLLWGVIVEQQGGRHTFFKPGAMNAQRAEEVLGLKLKRR